MPAEAVKHVSVASTLPGMTSPHVSRDALEDRPTGNAPPTGSVPSAEALALLTSLRASIDNLDAAVVHLLAERFKCTQKVGELKAREGMPASDPAREAQQIERLHRLAREADLDPVFAERFLNFVVAEVIRHHRAQAGRLGARLEEHPEDRSIED